MTSIVAFDEYDSTFNNSAFKRWTQVQQQSEKSFAGDAQAVMYNAQQKMNRMANASSCPALQSLNTVKMFSQIDDLSQKVQMMYSSINVVLEQIQRGNDWINDIIPSIDASLRDSIAFAYSDLTQAAKRASLLSVLDKLEESDIPEPVDVDCALLSEEAKSEIVNNWNEAVKDPVNWEQRIWKLIADIQAKHPLWAWIFKNIILVIIFNNIVPSVCAPLIGTLLAHANLREEPSSHAANTYQVPKSQIVEVVDDEPYYYLVEFEAPDTKEIVQGYISKRSIQLIK